MTDRVSYYDILRISPNASDEEVRQAYRKLAMQFHPDRNPQDRRRAELRLKLINEAYASLNNREKRRRYNNLFRKKTLQAAAINDNPAPAGKRPAVGWLAENLMEIFWPFVRSAANAAGTGKDGETQGM